MLTSQGFVEAISDYKSDFCIGNVEAAADSFGLAVGSGSEEDIQATAKNFADSCGHNATEVVSLAALSFRNTTEADAVAIAKTLGYAYGTYGGNYEYLVANASAKAFAKAIGDEFLIGKVAAKSFANAYIAADVDYSGGAFVLSVAEAIDEEDCIKFVQVLDDSYIFSQSNTGYDGFGDAFIAVKESSDCYKN